MARTTEALIEGIIEVDSAILLTPFIDAANMLVTQFCTDLVTDYTAAELIKIETWLAAHFYTVREGRAFEERAGPVSERKQSKVDLGFATSHYGQMAMTLDYYGGLSSLNERIKKGKASRISVSWLGTEKKTETNIDS